MPDRCLDPDETDQGAPYVTVVPGYCVKCQRSVRVSESVLPMREHWVYRCWCGLEIRCTPVQEPN